MELFIKIFKQLPPFWPRVAAIVVIGLVLLLPKLRPLISSASRNRRRLDHAKRLLELRKLQVDVAVARASHPEIAESEIDRQIETILDRAIEDGDDDDRPPLPWRERATLAAMGTLAFIVVGVLGLWVAADRTVGEIAMTALRELPVLVPGALIASAIPSQYRSSTVVAGFVVPVLLTALAVTARG